MSKTKTTPRNFGRSFRRLVVEHIRHNPYFPRNKITDADFCLFAIAEYEAFRVWHPTAYLGYRMREETCLGISGIGKSQYSSLTR